MNRPWLLIAASGITVGALFGWAGAIMFGIAAALSVALTGQRWIVITLVALAAALLGAARVAITPEPTISPVVLESTHAEGRVVGQPQSGPSGPRAVLEIEQVRAGDDGWQSAEGRVLVFLRDTAPTGVASGDRLRLVWSITAIDDYDPGFRRFVASSRAAAGAWSFNTTVLERGNSPASLPSRLRATVTSRIESAVDGDAGALVAGFVTGDDSGLSDATRDAFDLTNTSHVTAVSGSNVAVLLSVWLAMVPSRRLQRSVPALLGAIVLIWLYVLLVGMVPGAVRAGLFASIMLPAARLGRRADPLTALMTASALMLVLAPALAVNVGFWLSLAASGAMVTALSFSSRDSGTSILRNGVIALVAAQVATLPITFWMFDGWSPGSLVANLIIGPLVTLAFPFAFVTAVLVLIVPWVGDVVGWLPELGAGLIISLVESLAGEFPMIRSAAGSPVAIGLFALMCLLVVGSISVDVRRWLLRVARCHDRVTTYAPAALLGGALGVWLAVALVSWLR